MLRTLLADRFRLRTHYETRDTAVYAITADPQGTFGNEFRRSSHDCDALIAAGRKPTDPNPPLDAKMRPVCWQNYKFNVEGPGTVQIRYAGELRQLTTRTQQCFDRPLVDMTGLRGSFEWALTFASDPRRAKSSNLPSISVAFEEQLGLRVQPRSAPLEVLVIDAVEMPTPN